MSDFYLRKKKFEFTSNINENSSYPLEIPISNNQSHSWKVTVSYENRSNRCSPVPHVYISLTGGQDVADDFGYEKAYCIFEILNKEKFPIFSYKGYTESPDHTKFNFNHFCNLSKLERDNADFYDKILFFTLTLGTVYDQNEVKSFEPVKELYDQGLFTDMTIETKDRSFPCHKLVLASEGGYFVKLLQEIQEDTEDSKNKSVLDWREKFNSDTVADFLEYIYSAKMPSNIEKTCFSLIELSELCKNGELEAMCEFTMCQIISVDNVVDMLVVAEKLPSFDTEDLKERAVDFITANFKDVAQTEAWKNLEPDITKKLLYTVFNVMYYRN